jgi:hypothetical protein
MNDMALEWNGMVHAHDDIPEYGVLEYGVPEYYTVTEYSGVLQVLLLRTPYGRYIF